MRIQLLHRELDISCAAEHERRVSDLAADLEARMLQTAGADEVTRLAVAALALIDEAQLAHAALERARLEIERLTDLLVEARRAPDHQMTPDNRHAPAPSPPYAAQGSA